MKEYEEKESLERDNEANSASFSTARSTSTITTLLGHTGKAPDEKGEMRHSRGMRKIESNEDHWL
jgi:hypothetical protein